jgi:hypothetical protein
MTYIPLYLTTHSSYQKSFIIPAARHLASADTLIFA